MINYAPLHKTLKEQGKVLSDFRESIGLNSRTQAIINKNEPVSLATIAKICQELQVPIEEVVYIDYTTKNK
ncbi:helix-turn-helix domain-containing protein [Niallia circulans]|uniref:helix-turn-helix domain-containing protein n=1 Tax=Niallia circulans TaxID=1397 RepID=UPI00155F9D44|nr:helix-turn-helix transcriptional regulator [Niallia circulans]NRG33916.1 helix-turn-helix transcriptional regulator [Niallia circulans]